MFRTTSPLAAIFFFFQAEAGIRDLTVTGVQTCALPISHGPRRDRQALRGRAADDHGSRRRFDAHTPRPRRMPLLRSEEHTSELQSQSNLVCRLLLEKKKEEILQAFSFDTEMAV